MRISNKTPSHFSFLRKGGDTKMLILCCKVCWYSQHGNREHFMINNDIYAVFLNLKTGTLRVREVAELQCSIN